MDILFLIVALIIGLAIILEVLNLGATELFATFTGEGESKDTVRKIAAELAESDKTIEAKKAAIRVVFDEADKAKNELNKLERDLLQKRQSPTVLIFRVGIEAQGTPPFRAPMTKAIPETAEPHQKMVWKVPAFVDTWAESPRQAMSKVTEQFRPELGYIVGEFTRRGETA